MATKYDLPQFRTPTQQMRRMPIVRTPNYGEIYAKSFLAGQQMSKQAFEPLLNALRQKSIERKAADKETEALGERLDATVETMFSGTSTLDQKNRELYSKKADLLAESKKQAILNPNRKPKGGKFTYKEIYEQTNQRFKDELRNSAASTKNIETLIKYLEEDKNISKFQDNSFVLALRDEFVDNKGQGLTYRIADDGGDELYFKDAYGQDVILSNEFLANTDLVSLIQNEGKFSKNGEEAKLFQTLSDGYLQNGIIPNPTATGSQTTTKPGVTVTKAGVVYTEDEKALIKSTLLTDDKFNEIYADGSIAKSKFVHDWLLSDNTNKTLSIAREEIKMAAKAQGIELDDFDDQIIESMLFTYGVDPDMTLSEDELKFVPLIEQYVDNEIADYFYKQYFAPKEKAEQVAIETEDVKGATDKTSQKAISSPSGATLALLSNFETTGGVIDQIEHFHKLVQQMGRYVDDTGEMVYGGKGRLTEFAVEQFGIDVPSANKFTNVGIARNTGLFNDDEEEIEVYDEYQYFLGDTFVSSTNDIFENAYKFFRLKGSNLTRNQVRKLYELHKKKTGGAGRFTPSDVKAYQDYYNDIMESQKKIFTDAGGNFNQYFSDLERRRLENFRDPN